MRKNFLTYDEHSAFNEIVFENRNKEYGAYALRAEANATLQKAFLVGMAFFAVLAATPLLLAKLNKVPINNDKHGYREVTYIDETEKEKEVEKIKPIVVPPKQEPVKTQNLTVPEPKKDNLVTKEEIINPKVDDAVISTTTSPGKSVDNPNALGLSTDFPGEVVVEITASSTLGFIISSFVTKLSFLGSGTVRF